ncbi:Uncharacterized protein dnm_073880 [Desulfonema magnum]|uniref:Uncharacterized protein n=2 Tax=Desulfonema magnum TaxID=45655 RepID=A0A975BT62_9BACT|nr:Uncharacterized protein dnm_073880 [Desulfonema magnum]
MWELPKLDSGLQYLEMIIRYLLTTAGDKIITTTDEIITMMKDNLPAEGGDLVMTIADELRKEGYEQGIQIGIREGLLDTIEFGLSLRFGDDVLKFMPKIHDINDIKRLRNIKDVIKKARDFSEVKGMIEN